MSKFVTKNRLTNKQYIYYVVCYKNLEKKITCNNGSKLDYKNFDIYEILDVFEKSFELRYIIQLDCSAKRISRSEFNHGGYMKFMIHEIHRRFGWYIRNDESILRRLDKLFELAERVARIEIHTKRQNSYKY